MKVERRGKYPGIKLHLGEPECNRILDFDRKPTNESEWACFYLIEKIGKRIRKAIEDDPSLLEDRTEEDIRQCLEEEAEKAQARLDDVDTYLKEREDK